MDKNLPRMYLCANFSYSSTGRVQGAGGNKFLHIMIKSVYYSKMRK